MTRLALIGLLGISLELAASDALGADEAPPTSLVKMQAPGTLQAAKAEAPGTPQVARDLFVALFSFGTVLLLLSILPEKLTDFAKSALGLEKRDTLKELYAWTDYTTVLDPVKTPDAIALTAYRQLYRIASENDSVWLRSPTDVSPAHDLFNPLSPVDVTIPGQVNMAVIRDNLITIDSRMRALEACRVSRLRLGSMVLGVGVAWLLKADAFQFLGAVGIHAAPAPPGPTTFGVLLTGLGAGMGAPFWQDFLDTLTKYKDKLTPPKVG